MAVNKKIQELQNLLRQIEVQYNKLGEVNPFKGMDPNKVKDIDKQIKIVETSLEGVNAKVNRINTTFGDLSLTLKSVVGELGKSNENAKSLKKGMRGLVKEAQELAYEEEGINNLSEKQLEIILERAKKNKQLAQDNAKALVNYDNLWKGVNGKVEKSTKAYQALTDEQKAAVAIAEDEGNLQDDLILKIKDRLKKEKELNQKLGITGGILEGLSKIPLINNVVDFPEIMDKAREATNDTKSGVVGLIAGFKEMGKQAIKGLLNPANLALGAIVMLGKALVTVDKQAGEFAKNMGISYQESLKIVGNAKEIASEFEGVASKDVLAAQSSLNEYFGTSAEFSKDIAGQFAQIQKRTGLSNKALGMYSKLAIKSGKSIKATLVDVNKTVMAQNQQNKLALNVKDIQEGVAEASSAVKLQTKGSVEALANAVIEAKKLGTNLAQVEQISSSLLDFESSIQSELEAELLLGREINLERARAFALQGKTEEVAKEVMKNEAIMNAFATDNVIAQEAAAKAIGLTRDQLADMVLKQEEMKTLQGVFGDKVKNMSDAQAEYNRLKEENLLTADMEQQLADAGLANQMESASVAERFEEVMLRIQDIFIGIAEPVLGLVDSMIQLVGGADNLAAILGGILVTYGAIKTANMVLRTMGMAQIGIQSTLAALSGTKAAGEVAAASALTLGLGAAAIIAGIVATMAVVNSQKQKAKQIDDGMIGPGGEMIVSGPKGSIQLNKDDSIIAGTDLMGGGGNSSPKMNLQPLIAKVDQLIAVNQQILSKSPVIEMGGNEVGQGINTAEREIQ